MFRAPPTPRARPARPIGRLLACSVLVFGTAACGARRIAGPPNVVVVLVDTLRADRLSLYGYGRQTSPELDRFARERGVVFRSAWANAGCTFPSASSILTGRWPQRFLENLERDGMAIPAETPSLAERLAARGYSTAAVSASTVVRATPSEINRQGGFGRGFGTFDESCHFRSGACVGERAAELLGKLPEPFFLYLHYLDPHAPYRPPRGASREFSAPSREAARPWARRGEPWRIVGKLYGGPAGGNFRPQDVAHLSDLYDDEVRFFDGELAKLLAELERRGVTERTIVVLLADHGEELLDHGHWSHCRDHAYSTILETPLVIATPGAPSAERWTPVSNVDLVPTILDLAGAPFDPASLDGRSLVPLLAREGSSERFSFAAQGTSRAVRDSEWMLRLDLRDGSRALTPVGRAREGREAGPEVAARLEKALFEWIRAVERGGDAVRRADELERQLEALGYL